MLESVAVHTTQATQVIQRARVAVLIPRLIKLVKLGETCSALTVSCVGLRTEALDWQNH